MILFIDNFDSFTHNIIHIYLKMGFDVRLVRNQAITLQEIEKLKPQLVIIGPGPGNPNGAGISLEAVSLGKKGIPVLGVCLGHQTIGAYFGGTVKRAKEAIHGKVHPIYHSGNGLFTNIPQGFSATRYHSLILDDLPDDLEVTAWTASKEIMAVQHKHFPIGGVQFHPESAASQYGEELFANALNFKIRS